MAKVTVDPILTKVVQGYVVPNTVGHVLFPRVGVQKSGGKVIMFTDRDFKIYNTARAPGSNTKRIDVGYEGADYALENHSLEGKLPREHLRDANATAPTIKLEQRAVRKPWNAMGLGLEVQQAKLARDPDQYADSNKKALSGTSMWTDPDSDPVQDIDDAKEVIRSQCGVEPNRLVLSPSGFKALKNNPKVRAAMKITADGKAISPEMLAELLDLDEVVVGKALYYDEQADETKDVWGNDAILAYTPTSGELDREEPAFGYTYEMEGHPYVEAKYYDENAKCWFYPVTHERKPVIAGISAGFLFKNVA
ncbi:major capsid protein [Psychrobacter lutiphocae]|uniref:major capsid protein n=1 Tax=Psychrobacter lutiphocae TaxID=540500 RepID=UPI00037A1941|nr:major capsid protein [Psychrobacter lutiphocae]